MNRRIPKTSSCVSIFTQLSPHTLSALLPDSFLSITPLTNQLSQQFSQHTPILTLLTFSSHSHLTLSHLTFLTPFSLRTDYYNPFSYHTHSPHFDFPLNLSLTQISHPTHSSIFTHNSLSHHNISPVHTTLSLIPLVYSNCFEGGMW